MTSVTAENPPRSRSRARLAIMLSALALLGAGIAASGEARAGTGGAQTVVATEAQNGGGIAFSSWHSAGATWYGPGLYGRHTACGQVLRRGTIGVAHRSLPCGTAVKFFWHGRQIVTRVIDRGPYSRGNDWDLTSKAAETLGFSSTGQARIRYAVARQYARH